jgi:hypothetical protein
MHLLKIKPKLHHEMTAEKLLFLDYILRLLINSKFKPLASSLKCGQCRMPPQLFILIAERLVQAETSSWDWLTSIQIFNRRQ